ncbi:MAG: CapA family protein [Treponema sp.]|nr:CapA family protein [Treponema sp.]
MKKYLKITAILTLIFFTGCASTKTTVNTSKTEKSETISTVVTEETNTEPSENKLGTTEQIQKSSSEPAASANITTNTTADTKTEKPAEEVKKTVTENTNPETQKTTPAPETKKEPVINNEITLLFGGDIMAHSVNYQISTYSKIWKDIKDITSAPNLTFGNLEFPIDTTKPASNYPNFNSTQKYVQAAIDAGFDVFSLCNNHTNDQGLNGILETLKTVDKLKAQATTDGHEIYFSGTKADPKAELTYNIIEKDDWKILFLPITELLNSPVASDYINYIKPDETNRKNFITFCKELREKNECDLFIVSVHTSEPEYTRVITDKQNKYYMDILEAGADVVWANHAHIIKNRKVIVDAEKKTTKLIMYANGNTISGQRTKPELTSKNPVGERDNTGDGLLYKVTYKRTEKGAQPYIYKAEPVFITTYINTANEYVIKPLNQGFVDYCNSVERKTWAEYITRRIKINKDATKDLIEWQ